MKDCSRAILAFAYVVCHAWAGDDAVKQAPNESQKSAVLRAPGHKVPGEKAAEEKAVEHGFLLRSHKDPDGRQAKYSLFVPYNYSGE